MSEKITHPWCRLAWAAVWLLAWPVLGGEPAHVTLFCHSIRFQAATAGPGLVATLQLSSDSTFSELNGEVAPLYNAQLPSHGSSFRLENPTFPDNIFGRIAFDQPAFVDANTNGFDDFYEVRQAVIPTGTGGLFETPVESGSVRATWSRAAGSVSGTCVLELTGATFGDLGEFTATFEILEYTGPIEYTASTNNITGVLAMTQTQTPTSALGGSIVLTRVETNRFDQLLYTAGTLTNDTMAILRYLPGLLNRDTRVKTNYYGFFEFEDGDPSTGTLDFRNWVLSIDDLNDADSDGIPDLSDDPATGPFVGPMLTLMRAGDELRLTVMGEAGRSYVLEEAAGLPASAWSELQTIALTNSTVTLSVPRPVASPRFWRARLRE